MEVTAEFHGLISSSHGALTENERRELLEFIEAREFILALETLCGFLVDQNRKVSPELYFRIHSLGERLDGVDPYLLESVKAIVVTAE
ncbi:MAG TPA: MafI family immunity protein [Candidatus Dormibacteraeota bacterium]|jgi:hypothetical protein|nr:MafI family immunity protein [Candidatus Dormibacteraeota bacterium]